MWGGKIAALGAATSDFHARMCRLLQLAFLRVQNRFYDCKLSRKVWMDCLDPMSQPVDQRFAKSPQSLPFRLLSNSVNEQESYARLFDLGRGHRAIFYVDSPT